MQNTYGAVWVSHSSIGDYLSCPRAYFLKNVYKNPKSGKKIKLMTPAMALGQAVHEVLESLSVLPTGERFKTPLRGRLEIAWAKIEGKKGGFEDEDHEKHYRVRAEKMMEVVTKNPGPIARPAVKIKAERDLPQYWLNETDKLILCGKIDWLEYIPETDAVRIIDFKTSRGEESEESLQLPIYRLLVANCQKRKAEKASYWYLERGSELVDKPLPDLVESEKRILDIARRIKLARSLERFVCPQKGCRNCTPYEDIAVGKGEMVGVDGFGAEVYILPRAEIVEKDSEVL